MTTTLSLDSRYDTLVVSLQQIDALFDVATSIDTTELKPETLSHYFWIATDLLTKAKNICADLATVIIDSQHTVGENNHAN